MMVVCKRSRHKKLTHQSQDHGGRDVGEQDDPQAVDDRQGDGALGVVGLLAGGGDDVEADKCVEASGSATEYLVDKEINA